MDIICFVKTFAKMRYIMHSYNMRKGWEKLLTPDIVALLTQIHEFKGEQNLFIEANRDTLTQLLEIARIQSTEASNKIEGDLHL